MIFGGPMPVVTFKNNPVTREYEERAKNLLKGELKRRGLTYADLAEKLAAIGVHETERNIANKISRGGFTAAFLLQCLVAMRAESVTISN
jgi:Domain of unknown function (DUF6471)